MASININIPDQHVARVVHALCAAGGYSEETAANAKASLMEMIKRHVHNVERSEAERAAVEAVADPDTDGIVA